MCVLGLKVTGVLRHDRSHISATLMVTCDVLGCTMYNRPRVRRWGHLAVKRVSHSILLFLQHCDRLLEIGIVRMLVDLNMCTTWRC